MLLEGGGIASCPGCGKFQMAMVRSLKRESWKDVRRGAGSFGMLLAAALFGVYGLTLGPLPEEYWWLAALLGAAFVALWIWAVGQLAKSAWRFDPNSKVGRRRVHGSRVRLREQVQPRSMD